MAPGLGETAKLKPEALLEPQITSKRPLVELSPLQMTMESRAALKATGNATAPPPEPLSVTTVEPNFSSTPRLFRVAPGFAMTACATMFAVPLSTNCVVVLGPNLLLSVIL